MSRTGVLLACVVLQTPPITNYNTFSLPWDLQLISCFTLAREVNRLSSYLSLVWLEKLVPSALSYAYGSVEKSKMAHVNFEITRDGNVGKIVNK